MPAKGTVAKANVANAIKQMFGQNFICEEDKKLYVLADDGGFEDVEVAVTLTIPKIQHRKRTEEAATTSAFPEEQKEPKVEVSKEEQETLAQLMAKLGL